MINIAAIVEGYGDVASVPQLLAMTGHLVGIQIVCTNPIRGGEWPRLRGEGVLERHLDLAVSRQCDQILIVLDLDDDCCAQEQASARVRIEKWNNGRGIPVGIVFLIREYESLFLACADDLNPNTTGIAQADEIRNAKGMMRDIIGRRYKETQDQLNFTRVLDLKKLISRSRSYRKLVKEITGSSYDLINKMGNA